MEKKMEGRSIRARSPRTRGGADWCSISIPKSLYEDLGKVADARGQSISYIVRKWLLEAIKTN